MQNPGSQVEDALFSQDECISQEEPSEKRRQIEQYEEPNYSSGDTSTTALGFSISSLLNSESEPHRGLESDYHQNDAYEESFWYSYSDSFYSAFDPTIALEDHSPANGLATSVLKSTNEWAGPNCYERSDQSLPEQTRSDDSSISDTTSRVESLGSLQNDGDVCFGMIADVPLISSRPPTIDIDILSVPVRLCLPNNLLYLDKDEVFGELDDRTTKILVSMGREKGINFQIYCRSVARTTILGKRKNHKGIPQGSRFLMNVVLYGPDELYNVVGKYLTKCGIHLQDPQCDRDVVYRNPHVLFESEGVVMTSSLREICNPSGVEDMINEEDIFSKLSSDDHLSLTEAPDAIQTILYSHQKKALSFMMKREQGQECDGSQEEMWAKDVDETGQLTYTNVITELSQKQEPPDCRGGLLADQMGLGKTLTMISLIALNPSTSKEPFRFLSSCPALRCTKSTLIVVPFTLLEVWDTQLSRHLKPNTLRWMRFHGSRKRKALSITSYDIVITTFETLIRQRQKHMDPKCIEDTIFSYSWHRVVLDEAHIIRNRTTSMAQACCAVHATSRWAVTGTPIQNRVTDLGSLLEFIQVYPFSNPKIFDSEIIRPWLKSSTRDISRLKRLINCISLCRTKAIIDLPKRHDKVFFLDFSTDEREYYDRQKARTIQQFNVALSSNPTKPGQYLNALQWLNELRLICNHGIGHSKRKHNRMLGVPQASSAWTKEIADKAFETLVCAGDAVCSVCRDILSDGTGEAFSSEKRKPALTSCLNLTCGACIHNKARGRSIPKCSHSPPCPSREVSWAPEATFDQAFKSLPGIDSVETSTKLKALMKSIRSLNGEKSVVFSYWTYTLNLVGALLKEAGISYTRIDGQCSGEKREQANSMFQNDKSVLVILVSITCGGAGLDLTAAARAYLLEPQWNPQMEEQALSRIHRLGQLREVTTIRYQIKDSFEEKVVMTQDAKKDLAAKAFSDDRHGNRDYTRRLQEFRAAL